MARVLIAACLVACVTYVHTWGIVGHVVTGQIAQSQLSNAGKAMVMDVLSNYVGPNGEKFKDLGTLAPYADVLRPYYPWAAGYHFINIPDGDLSFVPSRDCANSNCVYGAILNYTQNFERNQDRGTALMFLTHFFGDLHQPLHVSHASDKGGNDIKLELTNDWETKYKSSNLHHVWDSDSIYQWQAKANFTEPQKVSDWISRNLITDAALKKYKVVSDLVPVADETYTLALDEAYGKAKGLDLRAFPISYYNTSLPTIQNQLMAGGLRLAAWLNKLAESRR